MSGDVAVFAVKSIGLSSVNGRKPCTLLQAARHNLREIQAELGAASHIDAARISQNVILSGPDTAAGVDELARQHLAGVDTSKLKRDHCQAIEAVFSLPAVSVTEGMPYFSACLQWIGQAMLLPVLSAVVHVDEEATHMHVLMLPIKAGKHAGGAPIAREQLRTLRESFFANVAGPHGLKRDSAKMRGSVKKWAIEAILQKCGVLGYRDAIGALWPVLVAAIERDPLPALRALEIEPNAIRPIAEARAIGLEVGTDTEQKRPIGLAETGGEIEALSCVGLAIPTPSISAKTVSSEPVPVAKLQRLEAAERMAKRPTLKLKKAPVADGEITRVRDCEPEPENWEAA